MFRREMARGKEVQSFFLMYHIPSRDAFYTMSAIKLGGKVALILSQLLFTFYSGRI